MVELRTVTLPLLASEPHTTLSSHGMQQKIDSTFLTQYLRGFSLNWGGGTADSWLSLFVSLSSTAVHFHLAVTGATTFKMWLGRYVRVEFIQK